jgi:hypothetical protein
MTWESFFSAAFPTAHAVTVEAYRGDGATGPIFDLPVVVTPCYVDYVQRLLRAPDGSLVMSTSTVYAQPAVDAPAGTRVTTPDGKSMTVIACGVMSACGLPLPEHTVISCE